MGFEIQNNALVKYTEEPGFFEICIPEGIKEIKGKAFIDCKSLKKIFCRRA